MKRRTSFLCIKLVDLLWISDVWFWITSSLLSCLIQRKFAGKIVTSAVEFDPVFTVFRLEYGLVVCFAKFAFISQLLQVASNRRLKAYLVRSLWRKHFQWIDEQKYSHPFSYFTVWLGFVKSSGGCFQVGFLQPFVDAFSLHRTRNCIFILLNLVVGNESTRFRGIACFQIRGSLSWM